MTASGLAPEQRPNLLGIGAAKAGTTWLAGLLAAHPDIYMPPQKELNALHYQDLDERLDEYAAYFRDAGRAPIRCDFSVRYLASPRAPAAAARLVPDARLICVLRDPVDQIQSHYWHLRRQNFHQPEAVRDPPDLFQALDLYPDLVLEPALYAKHLRRWLEHFPRERLLLIDHAELTRDLPAASRRICDFLDVAAFDFSDAAARTSASDARAGVQPRRGLAGRLFSPLYVAATRGPLLWLKRAVGVRRTDALKRALRLRQISETLFFKPGYPRLDEAGRRRLHELVADDIAQLGPLVGFDASAWRPAP